ncbi:hypothetical protein I7I51_08267 [Histoplasma capsulatum]|uniref:Uncharacterized protein n=1 Tax=Ajellomyces capsulatus TaxID=5037 RepID=A0A8A1LXE7_AJECA|nr:hypothetical protein I7I51_08267 [Histoplasma capsulatum]
MATWIAGHVSRAVMLQTGHFCDSSTARMAIDWGDRDLLARDEPSKEIRKLKIPQNMQNQGQYASILTQLGMFTPLTVPLSATNPYPPIDIKEASLDGNLMFLMHGIQNQAFSKTPICKYCSFGVPPTWSHTTSLPAFLAPKYTICNNHYNNPHCHYQILFRPPTLIALSEFLKLVGGQLSVMAGRKVAIMLLIWSRHLT